MHVSFSFSVGNRLFFLRESAIGGPGEEQSLFNSGWVIGGGIGMRFVICNAWKEPPRDR